MIQSIHQSTLNDFYSSIGDVRKDFPLINGKKPLVYFDNAATTQKPYAVLDTQKSFYETSNANVHRSVSALGQAATTAYETARAKVKSFINASSEQEIVFTSGTTAAINLVAYSWSQEFLKPGDEILLTEMEHHSNLIPWQLAANRHKARLRFIPVDSSGQLAFDTLEENWPSSIKFLALTHVSNVLGTINPIKKLISIAHRHNVPVLVDGAQAVPHMPVDVQDLDADFYAFSGHKMCGPTGIGILFGKKKWLDAMPPFLGGGDMINQVSLESSTWNQPPYKFEAGTPHFEGAVTLGAAIDYLTHIGMDNIHNYERQLIQYATQAAQTIDGLTIYGALPIKAGVLTFNIHKVHAADLGEYLDSVGIAIRCGHHCAEPLHQKLGVSVTARASFYFYNTFQEIDIFVKALKKASQFFSSFN